MSDDLLIIPEGAGKKGGGGGAGGSSPTPNPIIADDTERTVSTVTMVDVISEGPILGLVSGAQSVYLNNEQWMLSSGVFNVNGVAGHFRHGWSDQEPLPYKWISQTFDVNQPVKSSLNHMGFAQAFTDIGPTVDPSPGVIITNETAGAPFLPTTSVITLGDPGDGAKKTAVPTAAPVAGLSQNLNGRYDMFIVNPGSNVIGDGNTTLFQTYYYTPTGPLAQGPPIQLEGGVIRSVTNPNARAVRVILKVDKLYQQSGNGDIQPALLRFAIQYKRASDPYWAFAQSLDKNWFALPFQFGDISLPMYYPIVEPTGWNFFSLIGAFGPQFDVAGIRVDVAIVVPPRSRYDTKIQFKDAQYAYYFGGPDTRPPDVGWYDAQAGLDGFGYDAVYRAEQVGFNGSDTAQELWFTLYYNVPVNIANKGIRVIDTFGNNVAAATYYWAAPGPSYVSNSSSITQVAPGVMSLYAKTQQGFQLDYTVALPPRDVDGNPNTLDDIQVRVIRLTQDDVYTDIDGVTAFTAQGVPVDQTAYRAQLWITYSALTWAAYVELTENSIQYADTAVMGWQFNSQWTGSSVPSRAYDVYGRIVRIPSNYDAFTHTYTGIWDGTFVQSWTNNPVWIFLDLLTHSRYGLGQWVKDDMIDFAAFYQVAQYCDEPVKTDGDTDFSPRFTFNTQIVSQDNAYNVLAMLSSVFRGMVYWAAGGITITQDSPQDPSRVVTPANVINGEFQYAGSSLQARHSVVLVQWSDPNNFGKDRTDVWEDPDLINRYGYVTTEMKAWGCTSFSQAMRMARWLLDTEKHSTEVVTYRAGFDHADARPGEVVAIADPTITGMRHGGRIVSGTATRIIMDNEFAFDPTETYTLTIAIAGWGKVSVRNGSSTVLGVGTSFTSMLGSGLISFVGGTGRQYVCSVIDNTTIELRTNDFFTGTTTYDGEDLTGVDFTIFIATFPGVGIPATNPIFIMDSRVNVVERTITNPGGPDNIINLTSPLPMTPQPNAMFMITGQSVAPRLFTIVANKEIDAHTYEISALVYDPDKFARVESY